MLLFLMLRLQGYFEDRRPAANCDAYDVVSAIVETCCEIKLKTDEAKKSDKKS